MRIFDQTKKKGENRTSTLINKFMYSIYIFCETNCSEITIKKREFLATRQIIKFIYIYQREMSCNHKLKRKNNEEHHNDTLSKKIYMDRMIANDQKTDKLRMNARITTVFFGLFLIVSPPADRKSCGMFFSFISTKMKIPHFYTPSIICCCGGGSMVDDNGDSSSLVLSSSL